MQGNEPQQSNVILFTEQSVYNFDKNDHSQILKRMQSNSDQ